MPTEAETLSQNTDAHTCQKENPTDAVSPGTDNNTHFFTYFPYASPTTACE